MNRYGNPKQENGKITRILSNTWCHQCKMKHQKIVVCDHFWDENRNSKCNGRYCTNCCKRHYGEELTSLENLDNWTCYKCANKCVCAACRRLRGANQKIETTHSNPLIQKGKRKRNKVKLIEEEDEEDDEEEVLEEEEEEEFYPSVKFEKNLRSRKKNEKNPNSNNATVQNNPIQSKKPSPPRNTNTSSSTNNEFKKNSSPKISNPSSPTHTSNKNPSIPSESKKQKIQSPNSTSTSSSSQNPKIIIPQEDLDNASNSNYMFDILLQVSTLESNEDSIPKQNNNITNTNVNMNSIYNNDNIFSGNNNLNSFGNMLNNKLNNAVDLHQKLVKYESVQSNPLLPSSLHHIFQLRQEVSTLTNELKNMKQDFMKLHRLFESYVQTNEGSHESSPIGYGLSDTLHNSHLENLVQNN